MLGASIHPKGPKRTQKDPKGTQKDPKETQIEIEMFPHEH